MADKYPLCFVCWDDAAHATGEWRDMEEAVETHHPIWTVGFLIVNGKKSITVAATLAGAESPEYFGGELTIPKGCITKILEIPLNGKPAKRIKL